MNAGVRNRRVRGKAVREMWLIKLPMHKEILLGNIHSIHEAIT